MRSQRHDGEAYADIADEFDCSIRTAVECARGECDCDCGTDPVEDDKPWREEAVVRELFLEHNMFFTEMANLLGCHPETARNWVIKHEVSEVPSTNRTSSKTVRMLQRIGSEQRSRGEFDPHPGDD